MIQIFSGLGETSTSFANGLADLKDRLAAKLSFVPIQRYAWDETPDIEIYRTEPDIILIGHSYGGYSATMIAKMAELAKVTGNFHLILLDPVKYGVGQIGGPRLELSDNVRSCNCYTRRMVIFPPYSSKISKDDGENFRNISVWASHNSLPGNNYVQEAIIDQCIKIFNGL